MKGKERKGMKNNDADKKQKNTCASTNVDNTIFFAKFENMKRSKDIKKKLKITSS